MDLPADLFPAVWHGIAGLLTLAVWGWLGRTTQWRRLTDPVQLHLLLGCAVSLALLWSLRAGVMPGLNLHLLGAMATTLALGPRLAIVALGLALTGITLNGTLPWLAWPLNFMLMVVLPVVFAQGLRRIVERLLPAHFFIFVFVVAFFGAGLTVMMQGLLAATMLSAAGAYPFSFLASDYLPVLILLGFAEAWMSGTIISLLVVFKPQWVAAFDDRRYLLNK